MREIGIYIHLPFCKRKCPYCDFYSCADGQEQIEKYVKSLCRNIEKFIHNDNIKAETVYFGGGTPSLLSYEQVGKILQSIKENFVLEDSAEITLEANPSSVNLEKLVGYKSVGINRISFGVQSALDKELEVLGRLHSWEQAGEAVNWAAEAGFKNISCDIMLGIPKQTLESLKFTLNSFTNLPIQHISAYILKIESGTAFDCDKIRNIIANEDLICEMYNLAVNYLEERGFMQYEISNFSKEGYESKHNVNYWNQGEYLGFGPSAHSFFNGERFYCEENTKKFIEMDIQSKITLEKNPNKLEEYIVLGLRLKKGISFDKILKLSNIQIMNRIRKIAYKLAENNFCKCDGRCIYLTSKGFLVSNEIITLFLQQI